VTQGELVANEIERAVAGGAWHGPALAELLAHVSAEEAIQRPIPSAHNMWELVLHLTSWANIVHRRLSGGQAEPFEGEDWPIAHPAGEQEWTAARTALARSHERVREFVARLGDAELSAKIPGGEATIAGMLHGLAQHAAYHGGQIALLKKAVTTHHRRAAL
jgi:uncharacterized damage-inducible protein DinB